MSGGATTCPVCHGRKQVRDWERGGMRECDECDGLGVVRGDWYDTQGARDEDGNDNRLKPAGGKR